jgi:GT2 family glycosyltransferase
MIVKCSKFMKVGTFDDIFFLYLEDADLCWEKNSPPFTTLQK